jgi:hypothetical protein
MQQEQLAGKNDQQLGIGSWREKGYRKTLTQSQKDMKAIRIV